MTTNDELIERCARAAREVFGFWRDTDDPATDPWRAVVRAVLAEAASETEPRPPVPDQDGRERICPFCGGKPGVQSWCCANRMYAEQGGPSSWVNSVAEAFNLAARLRQHYDTTDTSAGMGDGHWEVGPPAPAVPPGPRVAPEPREEAARLRATLERVVTAYFDEDDSTDAAIKARDDELDAAIAAARALLAGRPEQEADRG